MSSRRLLPAILVVLVLGTSLAPARATPLSDRLIATGMRPVVPPTPATDLQLPDLEGNRRRLSDFQGNWVLLTFFATWCGPCRMEMPSLQLIDEKLSGRGFRVLGVSIDDSPQKAARFVADLGVEFPVLWDERGVAANAYRASSIPLSYLIDPRGQVVGMARGARDWTKTTSALASLLDLEVAAGTEALYAEADGTTELPPTLTPPTADWHLDPRPLRPGESFPLDIRVEWAGTLQDYLLHPPEVTLPAGIEQTGISAESTSRDGRSVLTYRITLQGSEPGLFDLDPIELRYTPAFEETPVATRIAGPTVEIVPRTVAGLQPAVAVGLATAAVGGSLALLGFVAIRRRRSEAAPPDQLAALRERFEVARRLRLEGDPLGFLEALAEIERELDPGQPLDERLEAQLEEARYGGLTPSMQELDYRQRALGRRLEERLPEPEKSRIRFRPGQGARASVHHARGNPR